LATIEEYSIDKQNFYEYDAKTPLSITAGPEGCTIISSIRVPTITLP
jgi:hypothetical protein